VNIGGGFCDARPARGHGTTHDALLAAVGQSVARLTRRGLFVIAEPGRLLVADAGTVCTRVLSEYASVTTRRRLVIDEHLYGALSGAWHDGRQWEFVALPRPAGKAPLLGLVSECAVFGGTCDSVDHFTPTRGGFDLPVNLDIDDHLLVPCAGAYSNSAALNFNGMEAAGVVLFWRDGADLQWQVSPLARKNEILLNALKSAAAPGSSGVL